jgi:ubiquinone biosynthesis protein UbiJ
MTIRDLALESLERTLNAVIALDPDTRQQLARLHGKIVRITLTGIGLELNLAPGHDGQLQLLGRLEGEPDAELRGNPVDLMRASDSDGGHAELFAGRVQIDGDTAVAERFSQALAGLDIDWEEQLSRLVGDVAAHEIGRGVRAAGREGKRLGGSARETLSDYLTEESRVLPHRYEVDAFLADVDTLRDDVDRLEARIALLEKARSGDDDA